MMPFVQGVFTFTALLVIYAAAGAAMAIGVGALTGPMEWRGAILGSLFTAMLMLITNPAEIVKKQATKES